jgi:DNA replication and repair protein RecF
MLQSLKLTNFRNYSNLSLELPAGLTVLLGQNASGKTNILEAIYFFATLKSFRSVKLPDLVSFNADFTRLELQTAHNLFSASWQKEQGKRTLQLNGKSASALKFIDNFSAVLFTPDDLVLLTGEPTLRRRFLDSLLVRLSGENAHLLKRYSLSVKNRNALLLEQAGESELSFWEDKIAQDGFQIWAERKKLVLKINALLLDKASDFPPSFGLQIKLPFHPASASVEAFSAALKENRQRDSHRGVTSVGPHRDDFDVYLDTKNLKTHGSRGEQRTAVVALKFAEAHVIEELKNHRPVLLLDDIFSELDEERSAALGKFIGSYQTLLTCTVLPPVTPAKVLTISNGKILNQA